MTAHAEKIAGMLADIEAETLLTRTLTGKATLDERVIRALAETPRDEFVPEEYRQAAFVDGPLPIGHGQTISQPFIVALMSDLLNARAGQAVLEIGTGSGYQTAVLSKLYSITYSMELISVLAKEAEQRLARLGYDNVRIRTGNGYEGWPENAPYDGIIVTAAATHIPQALVEQLNPGGRLVIPVGKPHQTQELKVLRKGMGGGTKEQTVLRVSFVPMVDRPADE